MKIFGKIIDIINREIYRGYIEIEKERIKDIRRKENKEERYILPGLIDSHIHIESSMMVPSAFAEIAVRHGTVAVVSDPHEIANVMGMQGIEFMIRNGNSVPLKFYFGAPSCVPATPFENNGAKLGVEEIRRLLERNDIKYLSEMMNYPGVINNVEEVVKKLEIAKQLGKPVDGHAPGLRGKELKKYIEAGISTDHECVDINEAREKLKMGMKVQIREGSAARSIDRFHYLINENPENLMLCSDDLHPEMLYRGHINILVKKLIKLGYDIFDILRIVSLNPVKHYNLETGVLRRGDRADFIIIDSPGNFNIKESWIDGVKVYDGTRVLFDLPEVKPVNKFNSSYIVTDQLMVKRGGDKIKVIEAADEELITGSYIWDIKDKREKVIAYPVEDILKIVVKDRYGDSPPATAFVKGFGIKHGAFASSVSHDSHNIIAVGADDKSICNAVNSIIDTKGGLAVCNENKCSSLPLSVAGIMSDVPCGTIASQYEELSEIVKDMGCKLKSPFMTLSFMALLVIPELKISDMGLFDGNKFELTELFV